MCAANSLGPGFADGRTVKRLVTQKTVLGVQQDHVCPLTFGVPGRSPVQALPAPVKLYLLLLSGNRSDLRPESRLVLQSAAM